MSASHAGPITLGFKPTSYGFGWIAFSSPFSIHDWGLAGTGKDKNTSCLRKLETLLDRLNPHTMVIEGFEAAKPSKSERIIRLCRSVVAMAHDRGIEVAIYAKAEIVACFVSVGARSRYEIACAVARSFEVLRDRLPPPRKDWESPHRRMALFDAAAVVLAHYQLGAARLFDDLQSNT